MRTFILRLLAVSILASSMAWAAPDALPYRFLLVISDQWKDDASLLIQQPNDFQFLAALLKTWGLPFDILRLDHQRLDRYHLLDREGWPLYGTILWNTGAAKVQDQDLEVLKGLVEQGTSVVVVADAVANPRLAALAGLRYAGEYRSIDALAFPGDHFIVRGVRGREAELMAGAGYSLGGSQVIAENAAVAGARGKHPFLTVREVPSGGRIAWLGVERSSSQLRNQLVRDLLKRCLVWAQGYALYAEYDKSVVLFLDDMGASDKTILSYWHYRTLSEQEIRGGLIEPLKRHRGVLDINAVTGYVDRQTRRILNPWVQRVVDGIDGKTIHDFASTKRGLDAGVAVGVFEIQSHGWTHMLPDLDSPPGPWWDAPMDGIGSLDWYNEFGDRLRDREIPAAIQKEHLRRSLEHIREDFGVTPLVVRPGGGAYSRSFANDTARVAAGMGFGLATWNWAVCLSPDLVLSLESVSTRTSWGYDRKLTAAQIPWSVDAPHWIGFHDRDVALDSGSVERLLRDLGPGVRYMSGGEYTAYLHTRVERAREDSLALKVEYDPHYCRAFAAKESVWTLHLSDETRRALGGKVPEKRVIRLPKGVGIRIVR
jgi:peptidoglycan/xylan/chitin deacetylase (PgdA/CDA1 family)